jgi:hydroxyethylthiazole kinase-like uncharacterized protein yjeF
VKLLDASEIREWDQTAMKQEPISSLDLMERAANALCDKLVLEIQEGETVLVLCGPGNNGGDGLAITRILKQKGIDSGALIFHEGKLSPDAKSNLKRLRLLGADLIEERSPKEGLGNLKASYLIDALFGTGLSRPLKGDWAKVIDQVNASNQRVISIDIPSGMPSEWSSGNQDWHAVKAYKTLSIQLPKLSFFTKRGFELTSEWEIVDIGLKKESKPEGKQQLYWITEQDYIHKIPGRGRFDHKGHFGHALLYAGSAGMSGACIMAAQAALRSGVGLLTCLVEAEVLPLIQVAVPQAMAMTAYKESRFSALAAGPGIGKSQNARDMLTQLISMHRKHQLPLLLDADAINILAETEQWPTGDDVIYSPHPGEFARMCGVQSLEEEERLLKARDWVKKHPSFLLLKGGYSRLFCPGGDEFLFSGGHPSLAKAGSGDLLTGIILALLSQGLSPKDSVCTALIIHGQAAKLASKQMASLSVCYQDILSFIPIYLKSCGY